jgi:hypothetical protein
MIVLLIIAGVFGVLALMHGARARQAWQDIHGTASQLGNLWREFFRWAWRVIAWGILIIIFVVAAMKAH